MDLARKQILAALDIYYKDLQQIQHGSSIALDYLQRNNRHFLFLSVKNYIWFLFNWIEI